MQAPRAIVFDLDGTLIDSRGDIVAAANHALVRSGRDALLAATITKLVGDGARTLLARASRLDEASTSALDALVDHYTEYYCAHPLDFTRWVEGALEALEEIRARGDVKIALCTNKPRRITQAVIDGLDANRYFDATWAGGDSPDKKPSPGPLRVLGKLLGLSPSEFVMVGDGPQDVLAGRAAGCRTVGVVSHFLGSTRLLEARPDIVLESMAELPSVVRRWCDATARLAAHRDP